MYKSALGYLKKKRNDRKIKIIKQNHFLIPLLVVTSQLQLLNSTWARTVILRKWALLRKSWRIFLAFGGLLLLKGVLYLCFSSSFEILIILDFFLLYNQERIHIISKLSNNLIPLLSQLVNKSTWFSLSWHQIFVLISIWPIIRPTI